MFYKGKGEHSVLQLEALVEHFKESTDGYQQQSQILRNQLIKEKRVNKLYFNMILLLCGLFFLYMYFMR